MNIFIDGSVIEGEYQGSRTFVLELINHLSRTFENGIIYVGVKGKNRRIHCDSNVIYVNLNYKNRLHKYLVVLPHLIVKHSCDVVITQYFTPIFVPRKAYILNVVHDVLMFDYPQYFPASRFKRLFQRISIIKSDKIITVSEYSKRCISRNFGVRKENIHIVKNAIGEIFKDTRSVLASDFSETRFGIKGEYFICVSRIEPRKNIEALIRLAEAYDDFKVVLIGSNTFSDERYRRMITDCKNFIHLTDVSDEDMIGLISSSRLFVYPSFAEGFGIPPIEAAALGVPVVCSNATALKELALCNECFFSPEDDRDLLRAVSFALNQSDEQLLFTRDRIVSKYNWKRSFGTLDDILGELSQKFV